MNNRFLSIFLLATAPAMAQLYSFDVPGSFSTYGMSINPSGTITGYYIDQNNSATHAFIRYPAGNVVSFDAPGASTEAVSINPAGTVTGFYTDSVNSAVIHGFVRESNGNMISFDPTGSIATLPISINPSGTIAGSYSDGRNKHGFIRDRQGNISAFDAPGGTFTSPASINADGTVTGGYVVEPLQLHGFTRDSKGTFTQFDPPGSTDTAPSSINDDGVITGIYQAENFEMHSFVRDPAGNIATFIPFGAVAINSTGAIIGSNEGDGGAFIRDTEGNVTSFTNFPALAPQSINPENVITGYYASGPTRAIHGFVGRVPNTLDTSRYTGPISAAVWSKAKQAGVSKVIVQAWGGGTPNPMAESQLLGAIDDGLKTGAYILLNYFSKDSAAYQIGKAIDAIGTGLAELKFIVLDVEACCGEFTSWKSFTAYKANDAIMDPAMHIQKVTTPGMSGTVAPVWNDIGGSTSDGTVQWQDTGKIVISQADRVARISAAVSLLQTYNLPHGVVIYTDGPKGNWQTITGNCGNASINNCSALISLPLWDVAYKVFYGGDGLQHCGDGVAGLLPFTPYTSSTWQARSGNQYDWGPFTPTSTAVSPSWDEYEVGLAPAAKRNCNGEDGLFGLTKPVDLDYFGPALFQ
jgi:Glycosyl hydrolases family 25